MKFKACIATLMVVFASSGLLNSSQAASWPEKPIRMVVPFAPGGNTDTIARLVGSGLGKELGQTVLIENVSGASGTLGANAVAKAPADGYTLLMGTVGTQAINMSLFKSLSEKSLQDFTPVMLVTSIPNVLVVPPSLPVATVAELVNYAKSSQHPLTFASPGVGSSIHLSGEMFKGAVNLPLTHIPYRGSAPALTDLIGARVDFMFDNVPPSLPLIQSGKLKALAVTSAKRNPLLPDVPTMIEAGFPGFEIGSWNGVMAPAGTPPEIVAKLEAALLKVVEAPEFRERVQAMGGEARSDGSQAFAKFIQNEYGKWNKVISAAGIEKQSIQCQ